LERIADKESFEISFGKGRLPKPSVKEFEQVELALRESRDLSSISTDPDREFAVSAHYIEATKLILYERIDHIMRVMVSDKFMQSSYQAFLKGIWHEGQGTYDPESQFVIKDLAQDMISDLYQFEMLDAFAVDLNLLHYHELAQHMDKLENMRRALELGIRSKADRKKPITSSLYVLKSLEKIRQLPKE
jgi:hypothetical protein